MNKVDLDDNSVSPVLSPAEERCTTGATVPLPGLARAGFAAEPPGAGGHDQSHEADHWQQQGGEERPCGGALPVSLTTRPGLRHLRHEMYKIYWMFPAL